MKYSSTTQSFYAPEFQYPSPPADLFYVSQSDFDAAIEARANGGTINFVNGNLVITPAPTPPVKTQAQLDYSRYIKRAQVKDKIIAEFAAENMGRVRAGVWKVPDLITLTRDPKLNLLLSNINTLSFELAIGSVQEVTNPLITADIKAGWIAKLQSNLYLVP